MIRKIRKVTLAALAVLTLSACKETRDCGGAPAQKTELEGDLPKLGLMTSLPIYWSLDADIANLAQGNGEKPWQRQLLEKQFKLVPLDTLTPIPGLSPDEPETDPLAGLDRLAVIQPRGLSPADNVALDEWVRAGGHLLIALDPMLTGDYDLPLGDPRRPVDMAMVPPVVSRWGLAGGVNLGQPRKVSYAQLPSGSVPLLMWGESRVVVVDGGLNGCRTHESLALAHCDNVGEGTVTYLHDAAVFEHEELVGENGEGVKALLNFAFQ